MKIVISAQALVPWSGGSAFSEASLCGQMAKTCDVTVICRRGSLDYAFAGSFGVNHVHEYEPKEAFEAWRDREHWLSRLFHGVELLHLNGHWRWDDYFFARLAVRRQIPYLIQPRGMLLLNQRSYRKKKIFNFLMGNWIVSHAEKVIALSQYETTQFTPYHVPKDKIKILPNGISQAVIEEREDFFPSRVEQWSKDPFFLYLGRLEERKNLLFLVDVFAQYRRTGGTSNLFLVGPAEREYDKLVQQRIYEKGLADCCKILGAVYGKEKWDLVRKSKSVLYPTLLEPFGRVPFEAILGGALPIVPNESGSAEYLSPLIPKNIYQSQDPQSLLDTMKQVESLTIAEKEAYHSKALAWVKSHLSWDHIGRELMSLYQEILTKKNGTQEEIRLAV